MPGDRRARVRIWLAVSVVSAAGAASVWWVASGTVDPSVNRADLASFVLAAVAALVAVGGSARRRAQPPSAAHVDSVEKATDLLRGYAERRWEREAHQRHLTVTTPVMV